MKRNVFKSVICSLLIVVMLAGSMPAFAASVARIMKINGDYVRLRESSDEGSSVITRLRKGTKVLYWGSKDGSMYKVMTTSGKVGYVYGAYLTTYGAMKLDSVYVTTDRVQLYKRSGNNLVKNGVLGEGKYVMIYQKANGWAYIKTMSGKGAYCQTADLKKAF